MGMNWGHQIVSFGELESGLFSNERGWFGYLKTLFFQSCPLGEVALEIRSGKGSPLFKGHLCKIWRRMGRMDKGVD